MAAVEENAGAALLGQAWSKILAEFDAQWVRQAQPDWLIEHLRLKHITQPLLAADPATANGWSDEKRLARAKALRAADPAAGLAELRELRRENPGHWRIGFAYAAALLKENDPSGVEIMERLARENAPARVETFVRVVTYFERKGDNEQIERWSRWLKQAAQWQAAAVTAFVDDTEAGRASVSSLPEDVKALLAEACRLDPCVANAWLLEGTVNLVFAYDKAPVPATTHALALAIDPRELAHNAQDEETIAQRYATALRSLIPPDEIAVVRTYFTTESIPAALRPAGIASII
jgi:hypothetical protein